MDVYLGKMIINYCFYLFLVFSVLNVDIVIPVPHHNSLELNSTITKQIHFHFKNLTVKYLGANRNIFIRDLPKILTYFRPPFDVRG